MKMYVTYGREIPHPGKNESEHGGRALYSE